MNFIPTVCENCLRRNLEGIEWSEALLTVAYQGKSIRLGPSEFRVFDMLMKRFGQMVRRTQIFDELWGLDPDGGPLCSRNLVSVYVSRIRTAVATVEAPLIIESTWGQGYFIRHENQCTSEPATDAQVPA